MSCSRPEAVIVNAEVLKNKFLSFYTGRRPQLMQQLLLVAAHPEKLSHFIWALHFQQIQNYYPNIVVKIPESQWTSKEFLKHSCRAWTHPALWSWPAISSAWAQSLMYTCSLPLFHFNKIASKMLYRNDPKQFSKVSAIKAKGSTLHSSSLLTC